jgi:hypothetical protein
MLRNLTDNRSYRYLTRNCRRDIKRGPLRDVILLKPLIHDFNLKLAILATTEKNLQLYWILIQFIELFTPYSTYAELQVVCRFSAEIEFCQLARSLK